MRILMRAGRPPHDTSSNEAAVGWRGAGTFGANTGNMLYSDSVYRTLNTPTTTIDCDHYAPEWAKFTDAQAAMINERYDAYVLPLANAFRRGFAARCTERLTALINRLTIPVVVVGVGGQMPLDGDGDPDLPDRERASTIAFVRAVLEHSASIGVRGERTREMLIRLGFPGDRIDVIGCPSMYAGARDATVTRKVPALGRDARLAISLEGGVNGAGGDDSMAGLGEVYRANEEAYPDLVAVYQTISGVELVLWGETDEGGPPGTPRSVHDRAYREGRLRSFTHPRTWREFLAERDFAFGVRIHGNLAAISAGTPAVMLSVDSRTQELADYHGVPQVPLRTAVETGRQLAQQLYEDADFDRTNRVAGENWDRYHAFLERNGLNHIQQPGQANPDYDATLADAPLPPPITPISVDDPVALATRVRWLRQGRAGDRNRPVGSFLSGSDLDATNVRSVAELVKSLRVETRNRATDTDKQLARDRVGVDQVRQQVTELQELVTSQRAEMAALRAELDRSRTRVRSLEAYRKELRRPFERRAVDAVRRRLRTVRLQLRGEPES